MDYIRPAQGRVELIEIDEEQIPFVPCARLSEFRVSIHQKNVVVEVKKPVSIQRIFIKEASVFKPWIEDNVKILNE